MSFMMPRFRLEGKIEDHHVALLYALGLLSEDAPGVTRETAERELARIMPWYSFGNTRVEVGPNRYKTAALVLGLFRLYQQRGGVRTKFYVIPSDQALVLPFMTDAVVNQAKANPGEHPFVDYILWCFEKQRNPILKACIA
jgi:hypothetical protein